MKAGVLVENNKIEYLDVDNPNINHDSVIVKVRASGICGSDIPRVFHGKAHHYPIILGHEFSGEIYNIPTNITRFKKGDRVVGAPLLPCMKCDDCQKGNYALCHYYSFVGSRINGAFAEYVVLPEKNVVKLADDADFVHSVFFEPSTVALHALFHAQFSSGKSIAVLGCGTIGIFVIQWAKILGAKMITAFDISDSRLKLAAEMGADHTVNSANVEPVETAAMLTANKGYDYVIEAAGSTQTIILSVLLSANKGRICIIGTPKINLVFSPDQFEKINRKELTLTGSWMSYSNPFPGREWNMTSQYFANGILKVSDSFIYRKYPLKKIAEAFSEYIEPNKVSGKIILIND